MIDEIHNVSLLKKITNVEKKEVLMHYIKVYAQNQDKYNDKICEEIFYSFSEELESGSLDNDCQFCLFAY